MRLRWLVPIVLAAGVAGCGVNHSDYVNKVNAICQKDGSRVSAIIAGKTANPTNDPEIARQNLATREPKLAAAFTKMADDIAGVPVPDSDRKGRARLIEELRAVSAELSAVGDAAAKNDVATTNQAVAKVDPLVSQFGQSAKRLGLACR